MCQFCVQHGQGRTWYLEAANHSREMMDSLGVEEKLRLHSRRFERSTIRLFSLYDKLSPLWKLKPLKRLAHSWATARQKKNHFGQILPTEHVHQVFRLTNSIVRLPCVCRRFSRGRSEERYCLGLGFDPFKVYAGQPGYRGDFELLAPEEASSLVDDFQQQQGLVHTVWTMPTPFVASVCNCDMRDCGAMLAHFHLGVSVLFPGELKAEVSLGSCRGCRRCQPVCQFEAIIRDSSSGKSAIEQGRCHGCGVCRTVCPNRAITLISSGGSVEPVGKEDLVGEHFG